MRESSALAMTHDVRYSPPRTVVQDAADRPRPKRVSTAMRLLWAAFALGTPSLLYPVVVTPDGFAAVFTVLAIAFSIWLYLKVAAGRNWARVVLALLMALGVLALALPVEPSPLALQVLDWSCLTLDLVALWLLFTGESVSWFRPARLVT